MPEIEDNDPAKAEDTPTGQEKYFNTSTFGFLVYIFCLNTMCFIVNAKFLKSLYDNKIQVG